SFVNGEDSKVDYAKLSGIIIPGFASTQLRACRFLTALTLLWISIHLIWVWLDTTK
ncbi:hypothetical protein Ancab_021794, partial [Ancistrocladus abbreviatus]